MHTTPERADQFESTAATLDEFGIREKVRWATIESFDLIPLEFRIDKEWLDSLSRGKPAESVIELQPLLTRVEIDTVMRAIAFTVDANAPRGQRITGSGADFSGRQWLRGALSPGALLGIATSFLSVQSLHSPLISYVAAGHGTPGFPAMLGPTNSIADVRRCQLSPSLIRASRKITKSCAAEEGNLRNPDSTRGASETMVPSLRLALSSEIKVVLPWAQFHRPA